MLLSNETILLLIAFIGIAGIIVVAIGGNYADTVQSIKTISDQKNNKLQESIDILDITINDSNGFTAYITLANRSKDMVIITHLLDSNGVDVSGCHSPLQIDIDEIITIRCEFPQRQDLFLVTSNYNIISISL